jgi:hypothetical protein
MIRRTFAVLLVGIAVGIAVSVVYLMRPPAPSAPMDTEPDPSQSKPLDRWPDAEDLARLKSVEGKPKGQVIQVIGHPQSVGRQADGTEVWDYAWPAACCVWIKDGVCTGTFYTAGY